MHHQDTEFHHHLQRRSGLLKPSQNPVPRDQALAIADQSSTSQSAAEETASCTARWQARPRICPSSKMGTAIRSPCPPSTLEIFLRSVTHLRRERSLWAAPPPHHSQRDARRTSPPYPPDLRRAPRNYREALPRRTHLLRGQKGLRDVRQQPPQRRPHRRLAPRPAGVQAHLVATAPDVYFQTTLRRPQRLDRVELAAIDNPALAEHILTAWQLTAPKKTPGAAAILNRNASEVKTPSRFVGDLFKASAWQTAPSTLQESTERLRTSRSLVPCV